MRGGLRFRFLLPNNDRNGQSIMASRDPRDEARERGVERGLAARQDEVGEVGRRDALDLREDVGLVEGVQIQWRGGVGVFPILLCGPHLRPRVSL